MTDVPCGFNLNVGNSRRGFNSCTLLSGAANLHYALLFRGKRRGGRGGGHVIGDRVFKHFNQH